MHRPRPVLLMTRPEAASQRFLAELGPTLNNCRVVMSPLIGIEFVDVLPDVSSVRGLIFTSGNGVAAWSALEGRRDLPAYTVGKATRAAATAAGLAASGPEGNVKTLFDWLTTERPPAPLLHLHGTHVRGSLARDLSEAGLPTHAAVLYDQPERPLTEEARRALHGAAPVIAPLFSPRTAELLAKQHVNAPLLVAGLSEAVVKPLSGLHKQVVKIARRPESAAMSEVVVELMEQALAGEY